MEQQLYVFGGQVIDLLCTIAVYRDYCQNEDDLETRIHMLLDTVYADVEEQDEGRTGRYLYTAIDVYRLLKIALFE